MKFSLVAIALAAVAHAQTRDDIPKCALTCLDDAIKSKTSCSITDYACVCKNFESLQGAATTCVTKACGFDVAINNVLPAVQALCAAISSGSGSTAAATSAAATSAAATSSAATSSAATSSAATSAAATSTASKPTTTAAATTAVEETTKAAETKPAATPSSNATTPTGGSSDPSESTVTGGAATLGSIGGAAMLVIAAFAL